MFLRSAPLIALLTLWATTARANPEPPATYDGRVAAMGGIALTTVDTSAAVYHNPAQLDQIERFSATVVISSLLVNLSAPFAGEGSEQESGLIYAPLFFVGAAGRIAENVTLGFGAYVYTGFGGGFDRVGCISNESAQGGVHPDCDDPGYGGRLDPPRAQEVFLFVTELSLSAQVSLLPNLSLGASLRIPWAQQTVDVTQETFGVFANARQNVSGVGNPGVLAGLTYRPTDDFAIALAYRSKVGIEMSGTTETELFGSEVELSTRTTWNVPHMVRVGLSHEFLNDRLLLATEFRAQLHRTANDRQIFESTGSVDNTTIADLKWKNAYVWTLGAEYKITPAVPVRFGMTVGRSSTNADTITAFSPAPGVQYGFYGGAGLRTGSMVFDLGVGWGGGPAHIQESPSAYCAPSTQRPNDTPGATVAGGGCPGRYSTNSWFLTFSATVDVD